MEIVSTWFGVFAVEAGRVRQERLFPAELGALKERARVRRAGGLCEEERELLDELQRASPGELSSRDRRLAPWGVKAAFGPLPPIDPTARGFAAGWLRALSLDLAEEELRASWDPSSHVEEAVRAIQDLEESLNLLGERLVSWNAREPPGEGSSEPGASTLARRFAEPAPPETPTSPPPALQQARRSLALSWLSAEASRKSLEDALEQSVPGRFPNLNSLLGAMLSARLLSQAGGVSRLSRMPASTIQVLGAERAFFEHLRGRRPSPRHGLLFLHPLVHTSPSSQRGRIARALSGKVAIAARLDSVGSPLREDLRAGFESRVEEIRSHPPSHARTLRRPGKGKFGPRAG